MDKSCYHTRFYTGRAFEAFKFMLKVAEKFMSMGIYCCRRSSDGEVVVEIQDGLTEEIMDNYMASVFSIFREKLMGYNSFDYAMEYKVYQAVSKFKDEFSLDEPDIARLIEDGLSIATSNADKLKGRPILDQFTISAIETMQTEIERIDEQLDSLQEKRYTLLIKRDEMLRKNEYGKIQ